jgi:fructose-1,6-bisphosphatase/inositol monophosphatase family enzyme
MSQGHAEPDHELSRLRSIAEEAAGVGAEIVRGRFAASPARGELKGAGDYVTEVDRESEDAIRRFLQEATPDIPVLAEESGGERGDRFWAVDPLDGTTNFLLGFPVVAVSVALVEDDYPVAGAVRAPLLGLSFSAARSQGARSGSERIRVSQRPPERAVIAIAFPFRAKSLIPRYQAALDRSWLGPRTSGGRRRPRSTWPGWRRESSTATSSSTCRSGTWRPGRSWSKRPAGWSRAGKEVLTISRGTSSPDHPRRTLCCWRLLESPS